MKIGIGTKIKMAYDAITKSPEQLYNRLVSVMSSPSDKSLGRWNPQDYRKQVEANLSWVYICNTIIANRFAVLDWKLYSAKNGKRTPIEKHPFLDLTRNVNPFMNKYELKNFISQSKNLTGNCYLYLVKNRLGVPQEIWPVLPQYVKIVPDDKQFIRGYLYRNEGTEVAFTSDEILHLKEVSLQDYFYGFSPLQAASWAVDLNEYSMQHSLGLFQNQAVPGGVLQLKTKTYDPEEEKRLRLAWEKAYKGTDKAGKTAILYGDIEYKQIAVSPRDLDFILGRKMNCEEICGIYKVPMALVVTESVNRSNMECAEYTLAKNVIEPQAISTQEKINEKLLPMYSGGENLDCEIESAMPEYPEDIIKREELDINRIRTVNEIRKTRGLEPVKDGDKLYVPFSMVELGTSEPVVEPVKSHLKHTHYPFTKDFKKSYWDNFIKNVNSIVARFKPPVQQYFKEQKSIVLGNLNKLKSLKSINKINSDDIDDILFARPEQNKKLARISKSYIYASASESAKDAIRLFGFDIDFSAVNPYISEWAGMRAAEYSDWVNSTTLDLLRNALTDGMNAGEGIGQIADRIENFFGEAIDGRAEIIARTETITASNQGNLEVYREAGVEKKGWLCNPNACDGCKSIEEAGPIPIDDLFQSEWGSIDGPCAHPNCECAVLPVIE